MSVCEATEAALRYRAAGFSVLPIRADGSKCPDLASWEPYRTAAASEAEVRRWYSGAAGLGVGLVCDEASGNLGVLDFEFSDYYESWAALVEAELPGLLATLPQVVTPGKGGDRGRHVYLRCEAPVAGRKLARLTRAEAERRTGDPGRTTAVEVRGRGNQVLAPGCPAACHPTGRRYELAPGSVPIEGTPTLTVEQVKALLALARALESPEAARASTVAGPAAPPGGGERPGDAYNRAGDWRGLLEGHGWEAVRESRGVTYWCRPGKRRSVSATTGHCSNAASGDLFYVFTTNAEPFESGRAYSRFAAFALLEHGGDFARAAADLASRGYGDAAPAAEVAAGGGAPAGPAEPADGGELEVERPEIAPWPDGALPEPLEDYALALARSYSCPVDFFGAAMLAVAGVAVGASRALAVTRKWVEMPRLFLAVVAEPGGAKSPALDAVMEPLCDRQHDLHQAWLAEKARAEAQLEEYEAEQRAYLRAKKGENPPAGGPPEKPEVEPYQHLYTTNATTEALVPMLAENPRGMVVFMDELTGWIGSMNQYKGGKGSDRQFWLSAWSGSPSKVDRKANRENGPLIVQRPFLSVLGGIQPDMLGDLADERGREDGFVHRLLFCFPAESRWSERIVEAPSGGQEEAWRGAVSSMLAWDMEMTDRGPRPYRVGLTPEGREAAQAWHQAHVRERYAAGFPPALVGPWSKMRSYFFRFALVSHCLRVACGEVTIASGAGWDVDADSVLRACALTDYFKSHARRAYARIACKPSDVKAERAAAWVRANGGAATARDLMRAHLAKKASEADELLKELADRGFGVIEKRPPTGGKGRPPAPVFRLGVPADLRIHATCDLNGKPDASHGEQSG